MSITKGRHFSLPNFPKYVFRFGILALPIDGLAKRRRLTLGTLGCLRSLLEEVSSFYFVTLSKLYTLWCLIKKQKKTDLIHFYLPKLEMTRKVI